MSYSYLIFSRPEDITSAKLILDNGTIVVGHPAVHSSGRKGWGFDIPVNSPNGNGAELVLGKDGFFNIDQRGVLWLNEDNTARIEFDDFILQPLPPPVIIQLPPPIVTPPPPDNSPQGIINAVYATGLYDLKTKEGCGKFTEACCTDLHVKHSSLWGHVKKTGAQNQYNGHAVDAVMLLANTQGIFAGIYDIIFSSESPEAKPTFNFAGSVNADLWYYPVSARNQINKNKK